MSEWPKMLVEANPHDQEIERGYLVVPADLARELYEALNEIHGWDMRPSDLDPGDYDRSRAALARYEREVGDE